MKPPPRPDDGWTSRIGEDGWLAHVGQASQVADARLVELADGAGRGVRVVELRNAVGLALDVVVDRALDLGPCSYRGVPLGWVSPVGVRAPGLADDGFLAWLRGFGGGLMATGGLDHTMFPETDDTPYYAYPARATEAFPLHGRLSREPGRLLGYGWGTGDDGGHVLYVEGEVTQAAVFGEVLTLRRRVEVPLDRATVRVRDRVVNRAHVALPHMLLYHVNLGWPLLDDGTRVLTNATSAVPRGEHGLAGAARMHGPRAGFVEEVTELRFDAATGVTAVVNDDLDLAVVETFDTAALPHQFLWRMLGAGTYVLGVEPSTNGPDGRAGEREAGRLRVLDPGQHHDYGLALDVVRPSDVADTHPDLTDDLSSLARSTP